MTRRRFGCLAFAIFFLLGCSVCWTFGALAPKKAGATALETVVVEFPPFPTQIPYPYPTVCVTSVPGPSATCGIAAISVGHTEGQQGLLFLLVLITLFGFTLLVVGVYVSAFVRR